MDETRQDLYWTSIPNVETPEQEVQLILATTDFTFLEQGLVPATTQQYIDFECGRLMIERCAEIMLQDKTQLSAQSIDRIKVILTGLKTANAWTTLDWNTLDLSQSLPQEKGNNTTTTITDNKHVKTRGLQAKQDENDIVFNPLADELLSPHTIVSKSLGQGKGHIETHYYGEAMPTAVKVKKWENLRITKASPDLPQQSFTQKLVSFFKQR